MEHTSVNSSAVRAVGYEAASSTLEVAFSSGAVYRYHGVPRRIYEALMRAESKGRYLNARVKGIYRYTRR